MVEAFKNKDNPVRRIETSRMVSAIENRITTVGLTNVTSIQGMDKVGNDVLNVERSMVNLDLVRLVLPSIIKVNQESSGNIGQMVVEEVRYYIRYPICSRVVSVNVLEEVGLVLDILNISVDDVRDKRSSDFAKILVIGITKDEIGEDVTTVVDEPTPTSDEESFVGNKETTSTSIVVNLLSRIVVKDSSRMVSSVKEAKLQIGTTSVTLGPSTVMVVLEVLIMNVTDISSMVGFIAVKVVDSVPSNVQSEKILDRYSNH